MDCMFKSLVERSDPEIRRYLQRGIEDKVFRKDARLDFYSEEADSLRKNGPEPHSSADRVHREQEAPVRVADGQLRRLFRVHRYDKDCFPDGRCCGPR